MKKVFSGLLLALLLVGAGLSSHSLALDCQPQQPLLKVSLGCQNSVSTNQTDYLLDPTSPATPPPDGDPITCVVTVENVSKCDLLATAGFTNYLQFLLHIRDPDGREITALHLLPPRSGPNLPAFFNPATNTFVVGDPVELVSKDFVISVTFNVRGSYTFSTAGPYTAREVVPVGLYKTSSLIPGTSDADLNGKIFGGTFTSNTVPFTLIADADKDGWCFPKPHPLLCPGKSLPDCEDRPAGADGILGTADDGANINPGKTEIPNNGLDDDCNPNTPDFQLVNPGTLTVTAIKNTVGSGPHQEPIANLLVRVFDKSSASCVMQRFGVSLQYFEAIWKSCLNVVQGKAYTDQAGTATMKIPAGNYLVIGQYDPDSSTRVPPFRFSGDEVYVGESVGAVNPGAMKKAHIEVVVQPVK